MTERQWAQAAQNAVDFLTSCEWNDHTSETDASNIAEALQDAIIAASDEGASDPAIGKSMEPAQAIGSALGTLSSCASCIDLAGRLSSLTQAHDTLRRAVHPTADASWTEEMLVRLAAAHRQDSETSDAAEDGTLEARCRSLTLVLREGEKSIIDLQQELRVVKARYQSLTQAHARLRTAAQGVLDRNGGPTDTPYGPFVFVARDDFDAMDAALKARRSGVYWTVSGGRCHGPTGAAH